MNGEQKTRMVATGLIIVSTINTALLVLASGGISLIPSVVRFVFTCVLSVFLFRQASWARLLVGILSLLGSIFTIIGWLGLVSTTVSLFSVISIWMILMIPFYLWVAYTLLLDKDVAVFSTHAAVFEVVSSGGEWMPLCAGRWW